MVGRGGVLSEDVVCSRDTNEVMPVEVLGKLARGLLCEKNHCRETGPDEALTSYLLGLHWVKL